jgi:hypothetical protein
MIDFCGLVFAGEFTTSENQVHIHAQVYIRLCELCTICPRCLQPLDVDKEGDGRIPEIERLFQVDYRCGSQQLDKSSSLCR